MPDENRNEEPEQHPRPTDEGSPIPDPEAEDTNAGDIPEAD